MRVRVAWGFLPLVIWPGRYCKVCRATWLCRTGVWAHDWLGSPAAARRNEAEAHR
jgi:hypothetical protein